MGERIVYHTAVVPARKGKLLHVAAQYLHAGVAQLGNGDACHFRRDVHPCHPRRVPGQVIAKQNAGATGYVQHRNAWPHARRVQDEGDLAVAAHHARIPFRRAGVKICDDLTLVHAVVLSMKNGACKQAPYILGGVRRIGYLPSALAMASRKSRVSVKISPV